MVIGSCIRNLLFQVFTGRRYTEFWGSEFDCCIVIYFAGAGMYNGTSNILAPKLVYCVTQSPHICTAVPSIKSVKAGLCPNEHSRQPFNRVVKNTFVAKFFFFLKSLV